MPVHLILCSPLVKYHPARLRFNRLATIQLIDANKGDLPRIQTILEAAPTDSNYVTGRPTKPDAAQKLFETLPQKKLPEDKLVMMIHLDEAVLNGEWQVLAR